MGNQPHPDARVRKDLGLPERYAAVRHVANGGMASVWCARDRALGRNVAIKLLAERFADDDDANARFLREARAAARLSGHPNVVMIYDVGETTPDGRAFIVMEFLAGGTVADAIRVDSVRRVHAAKWVQEAASALDFAHSRGVLHRDIKPANLLLDRDRTLHVADFGIARLAPRTRSPAPARCSAPPPISPPSGHSASPPPTPATGTRSRWSRSSCSSGSGRSPPGISPRRPASTSRRSLRRRASATARSRRRSTPSWPAAWPSAPSDAGRPRKISPRRSTLRSPRRRPGPTDRIAAAAAARPPRGPRARRRRPTRARAADRGAPTAADGVAPAGRLGPSRRRRGRIAGAGRVDRGSGRGRCDRRHDRQRGSRRSSSATVQRQASAATRKSSSAGKTPAAPKPKTAQTTVTGTPAAATTPPPTADTLEARGHQLLIDGDYTAALPVLRQAVNTAEPGQPRRTPMRCMTTAGRCCSPAIPRTLSRCSTSACRSPTRPARSGRSSSSR